MAPLGRARLHRAESTGPWKPVRAAEQIEKYCQTQIRSGARARPDASKDILAKWAAQRSRKIPSVNLALGPQVGVIIETPKGSRKKLKYDPAKRMYKLSKVMPEGMVFPYDFGFVPDTKGQDGDPLDVLVLTAEPLFPGCLVNCARVGIIEAEQEEEGETKWNDR